MNTYQKNGYSELTPEKRRVIAPRIPANYLTPVTKPKAASNEWQRVTTWREDRLEELLLPPPNVEVLEDVQWGRFDAFFTPAFWVARVWIDGENSEFINYSIGRSLREEVAACLLGGHGMRAEIGVAAFRRLQDRELLTGMSNQGEIEQALREPFVVQGRSVKYRFPHTKSGFVAGAMRRLNDERPPTSSGKELRNWLLTFRGVGPKTASWVARNSLGSDDVAILDIHIVRAGLLMGLFSPRHSVQKDYFDMEALLIHFAESVGVKLSKFDSMIWCYMRQLNSITEGALRSKGIGL
jgi:thermostable 8-oxoguanine DNA glycosylase